MDKVAQLTKLQKDEEKILIAKVLDKLKLVYSKNRFENTQFLDLSQKRLVQDILIKRKETNYEFFGGFKEAERTALFLFSNDFINLNDENTSEINKRKNKIYEQVISVISIKLPKELYGTFGHKNYLGAIIKLGVKREKIGDILVRNDGADIIILKEIENFLFNNLNTLTRFQKSKIEIKSIEEITYIEKEKKVFKINVPSMRLDAIVGELAKISRNDANTFIEQERVFINFKEELRNSKEVKENDIITIRGKGRYTINKILGESKSKRINIEALKW